MERAIIFDLGVDAEDREIHSAESSYRIVAFLSEDRDIAELAGVRFDGTSHFAQMCRPGRSLGRRRGAYRGRASPTARAPWLVTQGGRACAVTDSPIGVGRLPQSEACALPWSPPRILAATLV